jgi:hypothetical protein
MRMSAVRWGFTFLMGTSLISSEEKLDLVTKATLMYLNGDDRIEVSGQGYEGVLYTNREWKVPAVRFSGLAAASPVKGTLPRAIRNRQYPIWNIPLQYICRLNAGISAADADHVHTGAGASIGAFLIALERLS